MKTRGLIIKIAVEEIEEHPNNPRKHIGDISELTESIKANGVMQNLTVMSKACLELDPEEQEEPILSKEAEWIALIGHRRLAAAKEAGLETVPCRVVWGLSKSEQIGIMMAENVQRNDLTIPEQIESFQMMLDLGETVATVAEKTGFSESTVRRRTKNADVVDELESASFQLSFADLDELAKVGTEAKKRILEDVKKPEEIKWRVDSEISRQKREERIGKAIAWLEERGVTKFDGKDADWWRLEQVRAIFIDERDNSDILVDLEKELGKQEGQAYYKSPDKWDRSIPVRVELEEEEETETEEKRKRREADEKLDSIQDEIEKKIEDFIKGIISHRYECNIEAELLLEWMYEEDAEVSPAAVVSLCTGDNKWSVRKEDTRRFFEDKKPDIGITLLVAIWDKLKPLTFYGWNGYDAEKAKEVIRLYVMLKSAGFRLDEDEAEVLYGTSSLYDLIREDEEEEDE